MINLKAAGFKPKRDIVVLFTGDEETNGIGAKNGATEWLELLDHPEFGLNADGGGGGFNPDGAPAGYTIQTAEKTFADYTFTVRNRGGHSSKPRKDNAIYSLAARARQARGLSLHADAERDDPRLFRGPRRRRRRARSATRCGAGWPIRTTAKPPTSSRRARARSA